MFLFCFCCGVVVLLWCCCCFGCCCDCCRRSLRCAYVNTNNQSLIRWYLLNVKIIIIMADTASVFNACHCCGCNGAFADEWMRELPSTVVRVKLVTLRNLRANFSFPSLKKSASSASFTLWPSSERSETAHKWSMICKRFKTRERKGRDERDGGDEKERERDRKGWRDREIGRDREVGR